MAFQDRLLLYADILGWSEEIRRGDAARLLAAVQEIHGEAEFNNERARQELLALDGTTIQTDIGPRRAEINRMALEVQFGAFSDHYVFSLPASFGGRILNMGSKLNSCPLACGFATRGAVVLGSLYHSDNIIFGTALLDAVKMEEREAFYPRVLVTDAVIGHCYGMLNDPLYKPVITDQAGRCVLNPFARPFDGPDEVVELFVRQNFFLPEIKSIINHQIDNLEKQGRRNHAEKWRYLEQFIVGPVFQADPKLRPFWS